MVVSKAGAPLHWDARLVIESPYLFSSSRVKNEDPSNLRYETKGGFTVTINGLSLLDRHLWWPIGQNNNQIVACRPPSVS